MVLGCWTINALIRKICKLKLKKSALQVITWDQIIDAKFQAVTWSKRMKMTNQHQTSSSLDAFTNTADASIVKRPSKKSMENARFQTVNNFNKQKPKLTWLTVASLADILMKWTPRVNVWLRTAPNTLLTSVSCALLDSISKLDKPVSRMMLTANTTMMTETVINVQKNILFLVLENACWKNRTVWLRLFPRIRYQFAHLVPKDFSWIDTINARKWT